MARRIKHACWIAMAILTFGAGAQDAEKPAAASSEDALKGMGFTAGVWLNFIDGRVDEAEFASEH